MRYTPIRRTAALVSVATIALLATPALRAQQVPIPTTAAEKEKNWLRTVPGKGYFVIVRLYGPEKAFFDQSWRPGDVEQVK
jgi:hypothetical protein